jgi:YD repeat-containing protein
MRAFALDTTALLLLAAITLIMLALTGFVRAEERMRTLYNDKGQVTGTAMTRGKTTTFSNERGQSVGRAERRGDGMTNFYDSAGRMIGSLRAGSAR